ncbi:Lysosomal protective protein, partial [Dirofilaria immitis]
WTTNEPIDNSECATKIWEYAFNDQLSNSFNNYQDCYMDAISLPDNMTFNTTHYRKQPENFVDQGSRINIESTDAQYGFPCWIRDAVRKYLNLPNVRKALHIPDNLPEWSICSKPVISNYTRQYLDMTPIFESIIHSLQTQSSNDMRILIYNGDADIQYNFLSNEWFVTRLTEGYKESERKHWSFQESSGFQEQLAGYYQRFLGNSNITIDFLTIKGAGHFASLDRGGPSLQMFSNFVNNTSYNTKLNWDIKPNPILSHYIPAPKTITTRKQHDRIWNLPGLTFEPSFKQYSGYLSANSDYLHYWFIESQQNATEDPLILWLNGKPGCSSLNSFFSENGPFRSNPDNMTLSENNYAWNKVANVLFLESSSFTGFSQQSHSTSDFDFSYIKIANDTFTALMDFLTIFPEYINRPIFIAGHSHATAHILTLSTQIINEIQIKNIKQLNFVGIAIENGMLSIIEQYNSLVTMLFYRGFYDYKHYSKLMNCCKNHNITQPIEYYNFSQYVKFDENENVIPNEDSTCSDYFSYIRDYMLQSKKIAYEDFQNDNERNELTRRKRYSDSKSKNSYDLISEKGNFNPYKSSSITKYLNQPDVRNALHISSTVNKWIACNSSINLIYEQQYNDITPLFQQILNSDYSLNIMIYNGDADKNYHFLGDEWFIEKIAKIHSIPVIQQRIPWFHHSQIAGYQKTFKSLTNTIQLVTIKGAGHSVSFDRPGPLLQMLNNFMKQTDLSTSISVSTKLTPLRKQYQILNQIAAETNNFYADTERSNPEKLEKDESVDNKNMPGRTFQYSLETTTGYLADGHGNNLFFWWIPSINQIAPLIVWLGNGPDCSSFYDIFSNVGPYRVGKYGKKLYENPYSWDHVANMLFLEAVPNTGYSLGNKTEYNDNEIVDGLLNAIANFYKTSIGANYVQNHLYIFGQGNGSRYALLLALKLAKTVSEIPKLTGIGLGNSLLDHEASINIIPNELYFGGLIGKYEWDQLISCCIDENGIYQESCQLMKYVTFDNQGIVTPKTNSECSRLVAQYVREGMFQRKNPSLNVYNKCHEEMIPIYNDDSSQTKQEMNGQALNYNPQPLTNNSFFINQPNYINYHSTDAFASYHCYMNDAISKYLRLNEVRQWLNVSGDASEWQICNPLLSYNEQTSMSAAFKDIMQQNKKIKILIFDGDSNLKSNFLTNAIFVEKLAEEMELTVTEERNAWIYHESMESLNHSAGFVKSFKYDLTGTTIHLLTIKNVDHHVGLDQPAAALQMITNFLNNKPYNETGKAPHLRQILPQYQPEKPQLVSRQLADQIFDLPGLTYTINFNQYSGHLNASEGNYLHYWLVESQNDPRTDPLIIWFNGGPGCSTLVGLFVENGPFHSNRDGITLFENVFSWNKLANVLYIDSPRQVGFSYQDEAVKPDVSTRGTAGSDIWFMCLADRPMVRSYHLRDYD